MPDETEAPEGEPQLVGFDRRNDWSWSALGERWSQDRGTLLIGIAAMIAVVGSVVLAFQQNRFRPVAFPNGAAIQRSRELGLTDPLPGDLAADEAVSDQSNSIAGVAFELQGVDVQRGPVLVAIFDRAEAFDQNDLAAAVARLQIASDQSVARWRVPVEQLPPRFAVAAYQDHDGSGSLSRSALGIPSEPYGFSRDARATLGRPTFEDAAIDCPGPDEEPVRFSLK